ncbi:MAG: protein-L-isoaspartate O-methyltransferase family protein [Aliihoeflea sp.]|uniref:protein-L-isoaspartate O-methyltransferase family protein n=1 Tax=Aliihoeflea sp. 40Bstr573 TaxID=2696467 RepID=UPI002095379A|nr:protein-L-isoaspartate O-methyltransferase [Aliihoeflea sp. 40Bstr573]MCO6385907.1 methyltransferase domain-containing protein [Aliihoeflea sp. 40Bstr573]
MTSDYAVQRRKMVDGQLRTTDVSDVAVLDAMASVAREEFVPGRKKSLAYIDEDIEIAPARKDAPARFLMEPSPFGKLLQLAEIRPDDFILDVGAGTGYSAAILSRIGSSVIALESDPDLAAAATDTLSRLGFDNVAVVEGALAEGLPSEAPFDVIVIEGAVDEIPTSLFDQMKEGGRLVAVLGHGNAGKATLFLKENGIIATRRAFNSAIKPLVEFQRIPSFEF